MKDLLVENTLEKLRKDGFLLLKVSRRVEEVARLAFETAYPFFRSTSEEKDACRLPSDTGYRPFATEYSDSPNSPDQIESFSASVRMESTAAKLQSNNARLLYQQMLAVVHEFEPIAEMLTAKLANEISIAMCNTKFSGAFTLWSFLQMNYSLPASTNHQFINDLHEDGSLLTLTCSTAPGLEVRTLGGQFVPITTAPDEVLILPGEILWLMSGGLIQPLYHRVRPYAQFKERLSLQFFADMDPQLCKPWIATEINKSIDIGERVLKNPTRFGLAEWDWQ